jgi:hypothetical protein
VSLLSLTENDNKTSSETSATTTATETTTTSTTSTAKRRASCSSPSVTSIDDDSLTEQKDNVEVKQEKLDTSSLHEQESSISSGGQPSKKQRIEVVDAESNTMNSGKWNIFNCFDFMVRWLPHMAQQQIQQIMRFKKSIAAAIASLPINLALQIAFKAFSMSCWLWIINECPVVVVEEWSMFIQKVKCIYNPFFHVVIHASHESWEHKFVWQKNINYT